MAHAQEQILAEVEAVLLAASTAAGNNVFLDRVDPLQPGELPALLIEEAPEGESAAPHTVGGIERRDYAVQIAAVVQHATLYGQQARALGLEVEKAIAASTALRALAKGGVRITSSRLPMSGESETPKAARQQIWRFIYFVRPAAPDVIV